jgi:adenylate kinase
VLASGDLLRAEVASGSEIGREVDAIMRSGELVPDVTMAQLFLGRLDRPDAAAGAILDGFPRTRPQAEALDDALEASGRPVDRALLLEVPEEHLIGRFAGRLICRAGGHVYNEWFMPPKVWGICDVDGSELVHRADDAEETVRARMQQQLGPLNDVADHYRTRGILTAVNGLQPIEEVTKALLDALGWPAAPAR